MLLEEQVTCYSTEYIHTYTTYVHTNVRMYTHYIRMHSHKYIHKYGIAGKFDRELNLAVWQSELKLPN